MIKVNGGGVRRYDSVHPTPSVIRERHGDDFEIAGEPMVISEPIEGSFNPFGDKRG